MCIVLSSSTKSINNIYQKKGELKRILFIYSFLQNTYTYNFPREFKRLPPSGGKCQQQGQQMHLFSQKPLRSALRHLHHCLQSQECLQHPRSALSNLYQILSLDLKGNKIVKTTMPSKLRRQNLLIIKLTTIHLKIWSTPKIMIIQL